MTLLSHADYERIAANLSYPTEAFIGGTFAPALSGETMPTVNPATGKEIARVASCGREDVDKAVAAARKAFESGAWSRMHPSERKKILMRFIGLIEKHQVELAVLESLDSGKPVRECLLTDLPETIECLEWHAECADKQYGGISPSGDGRLGLIVREPAGVVACVLPWNFPLMMVGWKLGPALAEGNSVILKPASVTSLSTLKLAEFAAEAGIPEGVFNVITGPGSSVGEALGLHPGVDVVSFTGSTKGLLPPSSSASCWNSAARAPSWCSTTWPTTPPSPRRPPLPPSGTWAKTAPPTPGSSCPASARTPSPKPCSPSSKTGASATRSILKTTSAPS